MDTTKLLVYVNVSFTDFTFNVSFRGINKRVLLLALCVSWMFDISLLRYNHKLSSVSIL